MITTGEKAHVPTVWSDALCVELQEHAVDLGRNGNPAGFLLAKALRPFIYKGNAWHSESRREDWDYNGIRTWIAEHQENVALVWRLRVVDL